MANRARAFFYHYNKPASVQAGCPKLTVHYGGVCHLVDGVDIEVPTKSRKRKQQPRCVIVGVTPYFGIKKLKNELIAVMSKKPIDKEPTPA